MQSRVLLDTTNLQLLRLLPWPAIHRQSKLTMILVQSKLILFIVTLMSARSFESSKVKFLVGAWQWCQRNLLVLRALDD